MELRATTFLARSEILVDHAQQRVGADRILGQLPDHDSTETRAELCLLGHAGFANVIERNAVVKRAAADLVALPRVGIGGKNRGIGFLPRPVAGGTEEWHAEDKLVWRNG